MKNSIRKLVSILLIMGLMLSVVGCKSNPTSTETNVAQQESNGNNESNNESESVITEMEKEAPMLQALVENGELPALEDRMPITSDVMIEQDIIELGEYGGALNVTTNDSGHWRWGPLTEQSLFRFKQDGSGEVEANICKDFYSNEDGTVWTIELREGMKWSDGEPLTADDFIFYYDHMSVPALNEDRSPVDADDENYYNAFTTKPYDAYYTTIDGVNYWAEFEKTDDYKYTVTFKSPKTNFPQEVAVDNKWAVAPKHFFINIVSRKDGVTDDSTFPYITEEEALINANEILEKEFDSYSKMGKSTGYYNWDYYQIPQLRSFIATENNWGEVGEVYELVRNPYFFKTDSEGRQLPYLDSIQVHIINEEDQQVLQAVAGEFDFYLTNTENYSTIASSTQDTHDVVTWSGSSWGQYAISLNQTVEDDDLRNLFQASDFRQALSIAVDRDLVNATLANGMAEPWQLSPAEGMQGYSEEWSQKWINYDVEMANQLLDGLTEPWDGEEGTYRIMKGTDKEVVLNFMLSESNADANGDFIGLITAAYKEIGVKVTSTVRSDVAQAILANEHEVTMDMPSGTTPALRPDTMVPMRNYMGWYGAYGKWYEDNRSTANGGVEPTGDMLELIEAYDAIKEASGENRDIIVAENVQKIYELHEENVWVIGFLSGEKNRYVVSNELMNFPEGLVRADEFRTENFARPEQLYKEQ